MEKSGQSLLRNPNLSGCEIRGNSDLLACYLLAARLLNTVFGHFRMFASGVIGMCHPEQSGQPPRGNPNSSGSESRICRENADVKSGEIMAITSGQSEFVRTGIPTSKHKLAAQHQSLIRSNRKSYLFPAIPPPMNQK